jgi:hypothetical protein
VNPRAGVDTVVKRKIPTTCRESKSRTPIVQPVAQTVIIIRIVMRILWRRPRPKLGCGAKGRRRM